MAYISTEEVREIRNELKAQFPQFKFSVRKEHHSSVHVTIKSGSVDFGDILRDGNFGTDINQYHLHNYGEHADLFNSIIDVIKTAPGNAEGGKVWFDKSDSMTDYFHTAFYFQLAVGDWNKPYVKA